MNTILPIGSVVRLKTMEKPLMIFGYLQKTRQRPGEISDYIGVPYPEGNISMAAQLGFQITDIKEVLFEGYRTEEFKPWEELIRACAKRHEKEV